MPGFLVPQDLERMRQKIAPKLTLEEFGEKFLRASPGALVAKDGQPFRIPTLVPKRDASGGCYFLGIDERCTIHAAAPFGCAFFDSHDSDGDWQRRSRAGLNAIVQDIQTRGPYIRLHEHLKSKGLTAPGPEQCRARREREGY
jgi:hypothetical protein